MPKSTFGRSGGRLLRFWGMFLGKRFFIIFKARKNHPKILKMQSKNKKNKPRHFFINFLIFHKMRQPPECLYTQQFCGLSTFKIKPTKNAKGRQRQSFWEPFWRHLGDFGRPLADFGRDLGPSWAPRGSQNRPFWPQVAPKTQKMSPRMRHQKMYENLIEI